MESSDAPDQLRQSLREADRAEAAPWTDYPPTPWWYPPATGLWAAALAWTVADLDDGAHRLGIVALLALELGFISWYTRYRGGMWPTGRPPREFRPAITWFLVGLATVAATAFALATVHLWLAVLAVGVGITTVVAAYERAYAAAARRARERLA